MNNKEFIIKRFILFLLLILLLSIGHGNNKEHYKNLLKLADKEIENHNYAKALEYLVEVKVYAKGNDLNEMYASTLNIMGMAYTNMLYYDKAMECCLESYQITFDKANNTTKMSILNNLGELYFLSNNVDKAIEHLIKAYEIANELKDSSIMILLLNNLGSYSNIKGDLEQTEEYLNTAMGIMKNYSVDSFWRLALQYIKTEWLYLKGEYDVAEQLALEALEYDFEEKRWNQELKVEYLLVLSKIYYKKGNYSKAVYYAKNALENNTKITMDIDIYEHLSNVYHATNSLSLVVQCQDSIIKIKNSLTEFNDVNKILIGQIQFDLNNLENTMSEDKAKQKRNQLITAFFIIFIIALFLLILYVRYIKHKQLKMRAQLELEKEKLELEKEKNEKLLLEQEYKERETAAALERNTYKNEIEQKNRQLISRTLLQLSKNKLIEEIIHTLYHIPNQSETPEIHSVIQKLKAQMKEPANTDWNSFLTYFEQTNPAFLTVLKKKHPTLNSKDIRLSSYIYLNLDTKEIAKLLNITNDHCKKKKQYLAHKLGISTSEVYTYLSGIV